MAARAGVSLIGLLFSLGFAVFVLHHVGGFQALLGEWLHRVSQFRP